MILVRDETGEGNHSCPEGGNNCTKIEFLTAREAPSYTKVFDAIATGDQATIKAAFTSERDILKSHVAESDIDGAIDGTFVATKGLDKDKVIHFLVFSSGSDVKMAYQFMY